MKWIKYILIFAILDIVVFVNFNQQALGAYWNLFWYCQFYILYGLLFVIIWKIEHDILTRSLLISLCLYIMFHFFVNLLNIFNEELKKEIYKGKYINYILASGFGIALLILPTWEHLRACVKRFMNNLKK